MKTTIAMILLISSVASADVTVGDKPMVFRSAANIYAIPGEGKLRTADCTVTAEGMHAKVEIGNHKGFITFYDRNGEAEAQCSLVTLPTPTTPVLAKRTTPAKRRAVVATK